VIELGKTYFNTAGRPVRIVCVDRVSDNYPAVGLIAIEPVGTEVIWGYSMDGEAQPGHYDLIVPQRYVRLDDVLREIQSIRGFGVWQELDEAMLRLPFKELTCD